MVGSSNDYLWNGGFARRVRQTVVGRTSRCGLLEEVFGNTTWFLAPTSSFFIFCRWRCFFIMRCRGTWKHLALTVSSYVFYGWWNPWFMLLMFGSTVVDYLCGKAISAQGASASQRRAGLLTSVVMNLAVLGFFKYAGLRSGLQWLLWHGFSAAKDLRFLSSSGISSCR